jgi:hypothetical protein
VIVYKKQLSEALSIKVWNTYLLKLLKYKLVKDEFTVSGRIIKIINASELISYLEIDDFEKFLISAIGSHKFLHGDIDKIYETNKAKYYELYKNSHYFQNKSFMWSTTQNYVRIQRFAGIFLYEKNNQQNTTLIALIKKGYKFAYNYIKNKSVISLYDLRDNYLEFMNKKGYAQTVKSSHNFAVAIYLCKELNVKIEYDDWDIEEMLKPSLSEHLEDSTFEESSIDKLQINEYIKKFSDIGISKKDFHLTLNHFFSAINRKTQEELYNKGENEEELKKLSDELPIHKSLVFISRILMSCRIDPVDFQSVSILDYEKLNLIVQLCLESVEENELVGLDMDQLFTISVMIYFLAQEYEITKNEYLSKAHEETIYETMKLKEEYENKLMLLKKQEEEVQIEANKLVNSNSAYKKEIDALKKKLKESEKEAAETKAKYDKLENQFNEVTQVLEIYRLPYYETEKTNINDMIKFISSKKCVVVGGHVNWQGKLQSTLTNLRLVSAEELNKDISYIANSDAVLFNESVNSHSMYRKLKSALEGKNIPFIMIGKFNNIELTIQAIYTELKAYYND